MCYFCWPRTHGRFFEPPGTYGDARARVLARFAAQTLTPSDYLAACLEQISQFNPKVNALTALDAERAVVQASQATQRWKAGTPIGPLDDCPLASKTCKIPRGC